MIAAHYDNQVTTNQRAQYQSSFVILILIIRRDMTSNY